MSFDLAVRPATSAVTAPEATRKYLELTALEPGALPAGPRAIAFHRELTARVQAGFGRAGGRPRRVVRTGTPRRLARPPFPHGH
ncbi:hypothetical protein AB0L41_31180 [Amycolatopsis mediterranei]|uniref:hypothetical protein n=1 Tax=Amycolatopsis mediterranei TaxID=33910 RepID=UPI0034120873